MQATRIEGSRCGRRGRGAPLGTRLPGTWAAEVEVPTGPQPTQPLPVRATATTTPLAVLADHERRRPTEVRSTNPFTTSDIWSSTGRAKAPQ